MAAQWPTSVATDANLYLAVNELQNNLSGAINNAVTTIGLNSTTSFPTVGLVLIDNEVIKYTGVSGATLTGCTRGFDGTTAAAHSSSAVVSFAFCAAHHNALKDEIIALETSLNLTASRAVATDASGRVTAATTTAAELGFVNGVTSAIQTQLNAKVSAASPTFTGTVTVPPAANFALQTGTASVLEASTTTKTELGYVHGVTSAIQTQIDGKRATFSDGQLPGTATNDSASAGKVGEYIEGLATSVAAPTTGQFKDLSSINLTAGDWEVTMVYTLNNGAAVTDTTFGIGTVTGNDGTGLVNGQTAIEYKAASNVNSTGGSIAGFRVSLSGNATYYAKWQAVYTSTAPTANVRISARRMR